MGNSQGTPPRGRVRSTAKTKRTKEQRELEELEDLYPRRRILASDEDFRSYYKDETSENNLRFEKQVSPRSEDETYYKKE
ncbi:hypothetical protein OWV82_012336 [Melia azedarach]|uniref:Uncharacterized protein n=1 Tax=Melia azedarach TaxID=155640 RepID=A0ACC1Y2N1_MELAZ|nr:hypothetical protein OWV82_012336 [Melia azedarach]